jgi:hypothetical protein
MGSASSGTAARIMLFLKLNASVLVMSTGTIALLHTIDFAFGANID